MANIRWIIEKAREFQKNICFIDYVKAFVWITTNCGKFFKRREYQTTWLASLEIYMQFMKQQLELDMEQQTSSKLGKEYVKAVYCHPTYLTYMQSTSHKMPGWMKQKVESRLLGKIKITSDMQKAKRNSRASWWKWKRRVKKLAQNSKFKKWRSWHPVPSHHGKHGETMKTVRNFIYSGSKITADGDCSHDIKRYLLLEE